MSKPNPRPNESGREYIEHTLARMAVAIAQRPAGSGGHLMEMLHDSIALLADSGGGAEAMSLCLLADAWACGRVVEAVEAIQRVIARKYLESDPLVGTRITAWDIRPDVDPMTN